MPLKTTVFGCRTNTNDFLNYLDQKKFNINKIISINSKTAKNNKVAGYFNLKKNHFKKKVEFSKHYSLKKNIEKVFNVKEKFDIGFSIGWQRLIPINILNKFKYGVYGMHCSMYELPDGKGRSPINWSIIKGSKFLFCHIFKYTENFDDGKVVFKKKIFFDFDEDINTIQQKLCFIFLNFINNTNKFYKKNLQQKKEKKIIIFKKRTSESGEIDIKKHDAYSFKNFVRAQSKPYPGAFFKINNNKYRIWKINCFKYKLKSKLNYKILQIFSDNSFIIYFKGSIVHILEHEIPNKILNKLKFIK
tara:strand:- start:3347 stop:4255 length:909 start_codon:yes stop_codon:yes gene_type:complete